MSLLRFVILFCAIAAVSGGIPELDAPPILSKHSHIGLDDSEKVVSLWENHLSPGGLKGIDSIYDFFILKGVPLAQHLGYVRGQNHDITIYLANVVDLQPVENSMMARFFHDAVDFFARLEDAGYSQPFALTKSSFLYQPFTRSYVFHSLNDFLSPLEDAPGPFLIEMVHHLCQLFACLTLPEAHRTPRMFPDFKTFVASAASSDFSILGKENERKFGRMLFIYDADRDASLFVPSSRIVLFSKEQAEQLPRRGKDDLSVRIPHLTDTDPKIVLSINGNAVDEISVQGKTFFVFVCTVRQESLDSDCVDIKWAEAASEGEYHFPFRKNARPTVEIVSYSTVTDDLKPDFLEIYISDSQMSAKQHLLDSKDEEPETVHSPYSTRHESELLVYCRNSIGSDSVLRVLHGVVISESVLSLDRDLHLPAPMKFTRYVGRILNHAPLICRDRFRSLHSVALDSHRVFYVRGELSEHLGLDNDVLGVADNSAKLLNTLERECAPGEMSPKDTVFNLFSKQITLKGRTLTFKKQIIVTSSREKNEIVAFCVEPLADGYYQFRSTRPLPGFADGFLTYNAHGQAALDKLIDFDIIYSGAERYTRFEYKSLSDQFEEKEHLIFLHIARRNLLWETAEPQLFPPYSTAGDPKDDYYQFTAFYISKYDGGVKLVNETPIELKQLPNGMQFWNEGSGKPDQRREFAYLNAIYLSPTEIVYVHYADRFEKCGGYLELKTFADSFSTKQYVRIGCSMFSSGLENRAAITEQAITKYPAMKRMVKKLERLFRAGKTFQNLI